ncbi:MAG: glycerophosphodiester phosphodiesterase [Candidatus Dormibacteraeota bacterium]|nr:glycerophosphodiester phosphodiesterase [Candidatus Dormibacteraeota bacterium]
MARAAPAGQRRLRAVDGGGSGAVLRSRGFSRVGIVAHAALAIQRPGGAPDHASLLAALRSGVDAIEVDLCVTRDQHLVLRHDVKLEDGRLVDALRRREVERLEGELLTLDDAVEAVAWRSPLIIDVKSAGCAGPLGEWLARHPHTRCVVCSDDVSLLWRLRRSAAGLIDADLSAGRLGSLRARAPGFGGTCRSPGHGRSAHRSGPHRCAGTRCREPAVFTAALQRPALASSRSRLSARGASRHRSERRHRPSLADLAATVRHGAHAGSARGGMDRQ